MYLLIQGCVCVYAFSFQWLSGEPGTLQSSKCRRCPFYNPTKAVRRLTLFGSAFQKYYHQLHHGHGTIYNSRNQCVSPTSALALCPIIPGICVCVCVCARARTNNFLMGTIYTIVQVICICVFHWHLIHRMFYQHCLVSVTTCTVCVFSRYAQLSELVEHFFPVVHTEGSSCSFDCPEFSHFSFWRAPLPPLDLSSLL